MHWESPSQIQPDVDALSVDNQDTWLGIVVSKDHVMLNAVSVARKDILHEIAGSRRKLPRECLYPLSRRYSQASRDARHTECVPTLSDIIKSKGAYIQGKVNDRHLDILLDSRASCFVMREEYVTPTNLDSPQNIRTNADGREITTLGMTTAMVNLGNLEINHKFAVVRELAAPTILGCDFLKKQGIVIDFQKNIVSSLCLPTLQAQLSLNNARMCTLILDSYFPWQSPTQLQQ